MLSRRSCLVAVVLAFAVGAACKKESGGDLPAALQPRGKAVDVDKLATPALLAHVPADAPYAMAWFDPVPVSYLAKMQKLFGPLMERVVRRGIDDAPTPESRWLAAVADELEGKWNEKGLESLGIATEARGVLYGLGVVPVVLRLELADGKKLLAAVERIAGRAGATLPALENRHDREFWRIELPNDSGAIVAIGDKQLVVAVGPRHRIADTLPLILGTEKPAKSMADGKELKGLIAKHRLGSQMVGFADFKRIMASLIALGDKKPPPDCMAEVDRLTELAPRVVIGAELDGKRALGTLVLELAPALVDRLKTLKVAVPGFAAAFDSKPLVAMGAAVDLREGKLAAKAVAAAVGDFADACQLDDLGRGMRDARRRLSEPLPGPLAKVLGGYAVVTDIDFGGSGRRRSPMPRKLDGYGLLAVTEPKAVYEALLDEARDLRELDIPADGKLHALKGAPVPFDLFGGVGGPGFVVVAGDGKAAGERALSASGGDKAPFFAMALDYGRFFELSMRLNGAGADPDMRDVVEAMTKMFGDATMAIDVTDHGLGWWYSIDLK